MNSITFILQVVALICLLLAAVNINPPPRLSWGWLGMFFWLLSLMLGGLPLHTAHYG